MWHSVMAIFYRIQPFRAIAENIRERVVLLRRHTAPPKVDLALKELIEYVCAIMWLSVIAIFYRIQPFPAIAESIRVKWAAVIVPRDNVSEGETYPSRCMSLSDTSEIQKPKHREICEKS